MGILGKIQKPMKNFITLLLLLTVGTLFPSLMQAQSVIQVTADITTNTTWTRNNIYVLNGYRYIKDGATLTIEPGTIIKGDKASKATLIVSKTGKIFANGTATEPIVFTSNQPAGQRTYGDWGGIVMLGNATINVAGGSGLIEGGLLGADATYGGTNDDDSSGVLRYVRIEFPGIAYQPNNEINGLTMGGVGRKTVIENVQVSYSGDDSYEWFGGTVNGRNLVAIRGWDDDFDVDFGFRGKVQFGLVIRDGAIADQSQSNGFESDNDGTGSSNTPLTSPTFSNVTFIGPRENATTPNALYRRAMHLRRNSRTSVYNSVFTGYPTGLHVDGSASQGAATNNDLQLENLVFANMGVNCEQTSGANTWTGMTAYFTDPTRANETYTSTSALGLQSGYNSLTNPTLLPASGSILLSGASFSNSRLSTDPFWTPTTFRGAFGTQDWTAGWANFDPNGTNYSVPAVVQITSDINTNTTWTKDNIYILNGYRYIKDGATLTIEPGTLIKGDKASKATLIVSRTGKLVANGTACEPIVFTSNEPAGQRTYGDWGGIVMLGNATINVAGGNGLIEGGLLGADATYGGTNDDDSSGVLRYVRIEFPGIAYQPNNEINGLTMGGVGRKTVIENVQVSYSGDDCFEWFGGTVNGRNLIAIRGWDDDFDVDFGFRGKVQFGLVIRDGAIADQSQSNGFESDNDGTGSSNTPLTSPTFSNVTFIGPRENATTPNALYRRAMHLRRNSRTSVYNSVFTGYPTGLHVDGSASQGAATNNDLQLENLVFANMGVNFEQTSGANTWTGMTAYFTAPSRSNETYASTSALGLQSGYNSLTNPTLLPASGSILLSGASFSNSRLSTDPFWTPTTFRGAFGTQDWTAGWANFDPQTTDYSAETQAYARFAPSALAMTANSSNGSMTINFNPTPSASQHWVRYRAVGSATWNNIPVVNRPHTLVSGAGTFEVQAGAKVGNRTFWSCSSFITVLPTGNINRNVKFRVNMTGLTVNPAGVFVVGNLQGFNAGVTRLMPTAANPNIFEKDTVVYNGFTMNYKFANGDQITDAEIVPAACSVNDATYGPLRTVTVTSDLVLSAVLYGQCGDQFVGRVAGTLTYDNTAATAMTNSTVSLSGSSTGSQGTAAGSSFGFDRVVNGNYSLAFSTNKPWGGVSSSDALIINRHIVGSVTLAGIRLRAADVNNSATVTTGDALLVNRRVAGLVSSFTGGNWVYSTQTGSVNNDTVTVNAKALCVGDVNGSYVPSTAARTGTTTPEMNGMVETLGGDYTLEIGVDRPVNVGAVTLFIDLPAGMEVRDVQPALAGSGTEVAFKQEGRRLNIAWYTLQNWNLQAGEALIRIVARGNTEGMIQIDNASEIADLNAEPVTGLTLRAARLVLQNQGLFLYPNPSTGLFNLHHANTMDQIRVSDAMGKVVSVDYPASNRWVMDLSNLPLGIYSVEVRSGDRTENQKVVIR